MLNALGEKLYAFEYGNEPDSWYNNAVTPNASYARYYMTTLHHQNLRRMNDFLKLYIPAGKGAHVLHDMPSFSIPYTNTPLYANTILQQVPDLLDTITAHW